MKILMLTVGLVLSSNIVLGKSHYKNDKNSNYKKNEKIKVDVKYIGGNGLRKRSVLKRKFSNRRN